MVQPVTQTQVGHTLHDFLPTYTDACENFSHKHSQTLAPTGRESPQTGAFGDQHAPEFREHQFGQDNQHGNQFASGTAHRHPPGTRNDIHGGSTDTEHLVGEATLGLQPGQELRSKF